MKEERTRAKVSATLKSIGHKPKVIGGNGRIAPAPQSMLFLALQSSNITDWKMEMVVRTEQFRKSRKWAKLPTHYKLDIGSESSMICIECDGPSHSSMKIQQADAKKDAFLALIGFRVLRFSNHSILNWINLGMPMEHSISTTLLQNGIKLSVWTGCSSTTAR